MLTPCPPVQDICELSSLLELCVATNDFMAVGESFTPRFYKDYPSVRSLLPWSSLHSTMCRIRTTQSRFTLIFLIPLRIEREILLLVTQQSSLRSLIFPRNSLEHPGYLDELMGALHSQPDLCPELIEISSSCSPCNGGAREARPRVPLVWQRQ
jgi:hypothetical protein